MDLNSGYWPIPVVDSHREKTVLYPEPGIELYEFIVLPFELTGGPSFFQRIIDQVLSGLDDCKENFIDDILIFPPDMESHRKHLCEVFQRLRKRNLTLRGLKCEIGKQSIGHTFSVLGMSPQNSNVESIVNWPQPTNQKELKQFMGLSSYYRKYLIN